MINAGLLTMQEAQDALKCSRTTIYKLARERRLELVKLDRSVRVTERSLQSLIHNLLAPKSNNGEKDQ